MVTEARKLHVIEELLKLNNDTILKEVEALLKKASTPPKTTKLSERFAGKLSSKTAKQLQEHIVKSRNEWERDI